MPYRSKYEGADPGVPNPGAHSVIEGMKTGWKSLSHIAVLAPPVIPNFEANLQRKQLYDAIIEMNIMFDVMLMQKLNTAMLSGYDVIIVPDIPWLEENQLASLRAYKETGGKVYVLGSCTKLKDLATIKVLALLIEVSEALNWKGSLFSLITCESLSPVCCFPSR